MIFGFSVCIAVDRRTQINYYILFMYKCVYDGVDPSPYCSLCLFIWLENRANNLCNNGVLNLRISDPTNCLDHPTDFLPIKFSHLVHCRRRNHRNLSCWLRSCPKMHPPLDQCYCYSTLWSILSIAATTGKEHLIFMIQYVQFKSHAILTLLPRIVSGCLAWYMQKYLRCPFSASTVPMQLRGLICNSLDSNNDKRNNSVNHDCPRSINICANISVLFLQTAKKRRNRENTFVQGKSKKNGSFRGVKGYLLAIRPHSFVKAWNQFWS